jgi:hypothetical protein
VSGWEKVVGTVSAKSENIRTVVATCPPGKKLVGGGYLTSSADDPSEIVITASYPSSDTVWTAQGTIDSTQGNGSQAYILQAYALCATVN